jgi:hypothetical protein
VRSRVHTKKAVEIFRSIARALREGRCKLVMQAAGLVHFHYTDYMNPKSLPLPTENSKQIYSRENFDKILSTKDTD